MTNEPAAGAMPIDDYLAQGGVLTAPGNAPPRYRAEALRLMASFVDSELAASAGFADVINHAPGIKSRIAAARIVLEKADHAERVLAVMQEFGADTGRYEGVHAGAARLPRDTDPGHARRDGDMRLSVFHYPLQGWVDAVVMNVLQGHAAVVQITEMTRVSYQPLAEAFRAILPVETRHAELGREGLAQIAATEDGAAQARAALAYWHPRVAAGFGPGASPRVELLRRMGLRHHDNAALRAEWARAVAGTLDALGLN